MLDPVFILRSVRAERPSWISGWKLGWKRVQTTRVMWMVVSILNHARLTFLSTIDVIPLISKLFLKFLENRSDQVIHLSSSCLKWPQTWFEQNIKTTFVGRCVCELWFATCGNVRMFFWNEELKQRCLSTIAASFPVKGDHVFHPCAPYAPSSMFTGA